MMGMMAEMAWKIAQWCDASQAQVLVMQVASYSQREDDMKKLVNLKDFKPRNGNLVSKSNVL